MKHTRLGQAILLAAVLLVTGFTSSVVAAPVRYVAAGWAPDQVYLMDGGLNVLSSFAAGAAQPNGTASDGASVYSGHFQAGGNQVIRYDFTGNVLGSWSDPALQYLQGMTMVGGELAIFTRTTASEVRFYNPLTGAFHGAITNGGFSDTIEGLAYDGALIWMLGDRLLGVDPLSGNILRSLPNAAFGEAFGGTGLAIGGLNELLIGAYGGNWYRVSTIDGSVLASGNNGVNMLGLDVVPGSPVPEPGSMLLLGTGLVGLGRAWRKRRG